MFIFVLDILPAIIIIIIEFNQHLREQPILGLKTKSSKNLADVMDLAQFATAISVLIVATLAVLSFLDVDQVSFIFLWRTDSIV